jgi:cytochrome b involved in lipid metabolism
VRPTDRQSNKNSIILIITIIISISISSCTLEKIPQETGKSFGKMTENPLQDTKIITHTELFIHNTAENCWIVHEDKVYDLSSYLKAHTEEAEHMTSLCGNERFTASYHQESAKEILAHAKILGRIED